MELLAEMTKNETIALLGVIIAAIAGIIVPIILHLIKKKGGHSQRVDVGRINGNGTAIGDNPVVTIDKRQGLDGELVLTKAIELAEYKGRAEEQIEQLKEELAKSIERIKKLEAEGNRPDAEKALEELRESGDMKLLQELLIKEREEHRDALIQRNREIAAVSFLRGDIDIATEAVNEILKEIPEDLFTLNQRGNINKLRGKLKEAEDDYKQVLEIGKETNNEVAQSIALGNLGIICIKRGELNKAEKALKKSLEISEPRGMMALTANQYGNLGLVYKTRGELDKAEEMYYKVLDIDKKLGSQDSIAKSYGNLGNVYYLRGEFDKAEEMHLKALDIDKKIGRLEGQAIRYGNLGSVYEKRGDIGTAKEYWGKALSIYKQIGIPHMVEKVQGWIEELED